MKYGHKKFFGSILIFSLLLFGIAVSLYAKEGSSDSGSSGSRPGDTANTTSDAQTTLNNTTQENTSGTQTLLYPDVQIVSPKPGEILSGTRKFEVSTSVPVEQVILSFDNPESVLSPDKTFLAKDAGALEKWELELDTRELMNGGYRVLALAHLAGKNYVSSAVDIKVYNAPGSMRFQILRPSEKITSGTIEFFAETSDLAESAFFEIRGAKYAKYPAFLDGRYLKAVWNTFDFPNGEYKVVITALKLSQVFTSEEFIFEIKNIQETLVQPPPDTQTQQNLPLPEIFIKPLGSSPLQKIIVLRATASVPVNDLVFVITNATGKKEAGAAFTDNEWRYEWNTVGIPNGMYEIYAKAQVLGKVFLSDKISVFVENKIDTDIGKDSAEFFEELPKDENIVLPQISPEVNKEAPEPIPVYRAQDITLPPPPKVQVEKPPTPPPPPEPGAPANQLSPDCLEKFIYGQKDCDLYLLKKAGLADECIERRILSPELCVEYRKLPQDCQRVGIIRRVACERYMFSRYRKEYRAPLYEKPAECSAVKDEDCRKFIEEKYFPKECGERGVKSPEECSDFLAKLHLPPECSGLGLNKQFECNDAIKERYFKEECERQKFSTSRECFDYIFERYSSKVECAGLDPQSCKEVMRQRYLASSALELKLSQKTEEILLPFVKTSVTLKPELQKAREPEKDFTSIEAVEDIVPVQVRKEIPVTILPSQKKIFLSEDEKIVSVASGIIVFDDDEDGLPNDLEERFGTDPKISDSDGDGFFDGREIASSFNPLGTGELKIAPEPMELALVNQVVFEHPKVSGEVSPDMKVEKVENISEPASFDEDKDGVVSSRQRFSGKSLPNTTVLVYIYSSMPVVVVTRTDAYGNWTYMLKESLREGEHEVYVTVNDETGRVIQKSEPLSFFVKEAKAVTAKEFLVEGLTAKSSVWESVRVYLFIAGAVTFFGIVLVIYYLLHGKRHNYF